MTALLHPPRLVQGLVDASGIHQGINHLPPQRKPVGIGLDGRAPVGDLPGLVADLPVAIAQAEVELAEELPPLEQLGSHFLESPYRLVPLSLGVGQFRVEQLEQGLVVSRLRGILHRAVGFMELPRRAKAGYQGIQQRRVVGVGRHAVLERGDGPGPVAALGFQFGQSATSQRVRRKQG